ncbi:MAG: TRAM domain-containing protein, partial [Pelosinus sp.]|nr:TRAM domain-containing protein [Pelosinus sp.]
MKKQIPVLKGNTYEITISGLGHSGEGVGRFEDFTVFVPYALPGETVSVKITEAKKSYAKGKITKIHTASPNRIEPKCELYKECGGCQLQHLSYEGQLAAKRQTVVDAITRIGKLPEVTIHQVLGAQAPWYYRNKMQFPVGSVKGQTVIGCFAQGTHEIINTENCMIQHETNNLIAQMV